MPQLRLQNSVVETVVSTVESGAGYQVPIGLGT